MTAHKRLAVILLLGTTQTLGWASSFYLPAILADRIANDLEMSSAWFFAAFSGALVVSALVGPRAGRTVDAVGGREVLVVSNVILATGLALWPLRIHRRCCGCLGWASVSGWAWDSMPRHLRRSAASMGCKPVPPSRASPYWQDLRAQSVGR